MLLYIHCIIDDVIGSIYSFLCSSAFLMSMSFLRQLKRNQGRLGVARLATHYFNRYWRLTPTYMIVLMMYTNLLPYWAVGPFAYDSLKNLDSCATEWWKNMLYINNFVGSGWVSDVVKDFVTLRKCY